MIRDYVIIIGSMKSGSTTLFAQLDAHPKIAGARVKEPGFFAFEEVHSMGWDWYEDLFPWEQGTSQYALEASTDYTKYPFASGVTERFQAAEADGKRLRFIYIMRNPVDRLVSHARHTAFKKKEVGRSVSPRRDHSLDAGYSPVNLACSDYASQLEHYRPWFDRGDLHLVTLEQLVADGAGTMSAIGDFLDLPDLGFTAERAVENAMGNRRQADPLWEQMSAIGGLKQVVKTLVPEGSRKKLKKSLQKPVEIEGRFKLTADERAELNEKFSPQVRLLQDRYDFDPNWDFG